MNKKIQEWVDVFEATTIDGEKTWVTTVEEDGRVRHTPVPAITITKDQYLQMIWLLQMQEEYIEDLEMAVTLETSTLYEQVE